MSIALETTHSPDIASALIMDSPASELQAIDTCIL